MRRSKDRIIVWQPLTCLLKGYFTVRKKLSEPQCFSRYMLDLGESRDAIDNSLPKRIVTIEGRLDVEAEFELPLGFPRALTKKVSSPMLDKKPLLFRKHIGKRRRLEGKGVRSISTSCCAATGGVEATPD